MKLAIISTHPIQYNAPFFRLIQEKGVASVKVFYTWGETVLVNKFDPGFNKEIKWDIPLLEGYDYSFPENTAEDKGSHHFKGIVNPGLIRELEAYDPQAILVYGWSFDSHLKVLRHFKGKRTIIVRGDSHLIGEIPFYRRLIRQLFLKWVYRHADYALYVGKHNHAYYRKMGMKERQLIYGPHAIDNLRFSDSGPEKEIKALELRKRLSIPADAVVFLFAGKLDENKDPALLLRSFVETGTADNAYLVIIGNGYMEDHLKREYQHIPSIKFMDFQNQSQMPIIYRLGDVFVLPSRGETWGLAVNEAMASGRAIIISDKCGCAPDLIQPGVNGYVIRAGDGIELGATLKLMAADKMALKAMGQASREIINGFSFERSALALGDLFAKLHL